MFPISVSITLLWVVVYALVAGLAGACTGKLVSALLGLAESGLLEDGLLGMLGFLLAGIAVVLGYPLDEFLGYRFANPAMAALVAAPALPWLRQLGRMVRYRWASAMVNRRLAQLRGQ